MAGTGGQAGGMSLAEVIDGAVGPFDQYCAGYLNPGASGLGYISTIKLSTDIVSMEGLDPGTEGIVSYDRCEKDDAYIGQINMLTASSFCGLNGALWGYHLATADGLNKLDPLFKEQGIPVYPVEPLLDATLRLFGVDGQRRFNPLPGAHVVCANKSATRQGPCWIWCAIGVAIAEDRTVQSNLFIEDVGWFESSWSQESVVEVLENRMRAIARSVVLCAQDQEVKFSKMFVGYKYQIVPEGYVGCALTCAPYVLLAKNAVSAWSRPSELEGKSISQWEEGLKLPPLHVPFDDTRISRAIGSPLVTALKVRCGDVLDAIQAITTEYTFPMHGGNGGVEETVQLDEGEKIVKVTGKTGLWYKTYNCVTQVCFITDKGRCLGPYGTGERVHSQKDFSCEIPQGLCAVSGAVVSESKNGVTHPYIVADLEFHGP